MVNTLKLDEFLPYRLSIASNRVSGAIATAYHALFGLRIPEWRLVAVLAEGGEMTQRAIGHVTQMDKVTQSNAAAAEESAAAAGQLNAQARMLEETVAELVALVGGSAGSPEPAPHGPIAYVVSSRVTNPPRAQRSGGNEALPLEIGLREP